MTAQAEFDTNYISSTELCDVLGITRASLTQGHKRGALPEPIRVKGRNGDTQLMLWRRDAVAQHVAEWKRQLEARRAA